MSANRVSDHAVSGHGISGHGTSSRPADDQTTDAPGRDFRLLPVAVAAWCGSLLGLAEVSAALVSLLVFGSAVALWCFRRSPGTAAMIGAAMFAAVAAGGVSSIALAAHQSDPLTAAAGSNRSVRVQMRIVSDPVLEESPWGSVSLVVKARSLRIRDGPIWLPSSPEIRLQTAASTRIKRGDIVVALGRIDDSFGAAPPSAGTLRARTVTVETPVAGWRAAAVRVKERLTGATTGLPDHARGLIPGMAVGDDRLVSPELYESMLTTSLVHLTAVSGSHVAIVIGLLMVVIPGRGGIRYLSAVVFLILLVAVVGPEPSVLRAVGSAAVMGAGLLLKRSSQPQIALSAVVIAAVLVDPWMAVDFGFALSVLATWGIVYAGRSWLERTRAWLDIDPNSSAERRVILRLLQATLVSLSAQLWVLPVTLLMNPWVPLWGVLANVVAVPAVPAITLLGLAAAAVSGFSPAAAHWLCWAAVPFTHWIEHVAVYMSAMPLAKLPWPRGMVGVAIAAGLVGLVTVTTVTNGILRKEQDRGRASGGRKELDVGDRSGRGVFGSGNAGQGTRGGAGRPGRPAGSSPGARARARHRAD